MVQLRNLVGKQVPMERCEGQTPGGVLEFTHTDPPLSVPGIILAETQAFEEGSSYPPRVVVVLGQ